MNNNDFYSINNVHYRHNLIWKKIAKLNDPTKKMKNIIKNISSLEYINSYSSIFSIIFDYLSSFDKKIFFNIYFLNFNINHINNTLINILLSGFHISYSYIFAPIIVNRIYDILMMLNFNFDKIKLFFNKYLYYNEKISVKCKHCNLVYDNSKYIIDNQEEIFSHTRFFNVVFFNGNDGYSHLQCMNNLELNNTYQYIVNLLKNINQDDCIKYKFNKIIINEIDYLLNIITY